MNGVIKVDFNPTLLFFLRRCLCARGAAMKTAVFKGQAFHMRTRNKFYISCHEKLGPGRDDLLARKIDLFLDLDDMNVEGMNLRGNEKSGVACSSFHFNFAERECSGFARKIVETLKFIKGESETPFVKGEPGFLLKFNAALDPQGQNRFPNIEEGIRIFKALGELISILEAALTG